MTIFGLNLFIVSLDPLSALNSYPLMSIFTNDIFSAENKHYITLYVKAGYEGGEPVLNEPNKCIQWRWCDIN